MGTRRFPRQRSHFDLTRTQCLVTKSKDCQEILKSQLGTANGRYASTIRSTHSPQKTNELSF